jgi:hypothetical protein
MRRASAALAACLCIAVAVAAPQGQRKPPERTFKTGNGPAFHIELSVRSEVEAQKTETVGAKTYVEPFSEWVEQKLEWQAQRRVVSISTDGTAEIEEALSDFSDGQSSSVDNPETRRLLDALTAAVKPWEAQRTLRYRETSAGNIVGAGIDAAPQVDEAAPRVLTAWLVRALRPTAAIPAHPIEYGKPWQEPRAVQFAEWKDVTGSESGEWLGDAAELRSRGEPSIQLHATQEISGTIIAGSEKPAEGSATANFHAESLSTLALEDMRLLDATRSAVREVVWTLAPVPGLPTPPQFRGRLLVEIRIQACDETPCNFGSGAAERDRR